LINQWANVVRWEMRTRPFLRTAEFLWQEGHTAHATSQEAIEEANKIHQIYADFAENTMAMPVHMGTKTANERFAGAEETLTIEALMQDGKALQAGTSHYLGQNFAKAFDVTYLNKENKNEYVWATSWGVSTRLVGALIMTHSDDEGLVLPPDLAPEQVVFVPIPKPNAEIDETVEKIMAELREKGIRCHYDRDETKRPGFKFAEHEMRGTPIRLALGNRDLANNQIEMARRDTKTKVSIPLNGAANMVVEELKTMQTDLLLKAKKYREEHTSSADTFDEFKEIIANKGGFCYAHWDGTTETELKIKDLTKASIRCIPNEQEKEDGKCILTGKPSNGRVIFAKAY